MVDKSSELNFLTTSFPFRPKSFNKSLDGVQVMGYFLISQVHYVIHVL